MKTSGMLMTMTLALAAVTGCSGRPELVVRPSAGAVDEAEVPATLADTGLYADPLRGTLAPDVMAYEPTYPLWSDGDHKRRFFALPEGSAVDTSDPASWAFPVGTRAWKEFSSDGTKVETRYIERTGPGDEDFTFATYRWNEAGTDTELVTEGARDVNDTAHDIPSTSSCVACHRAEARFVGISALQLAHEDSPGVDLADLARAGLLSDPPAVPPRVPGDATARAALGYLHGNCGHCHRGKYDDTLNLGLSGYELTVDETAAFETAVEVATQHFVHDGVEARIVPGDPAASAIHVRMAGTEPEVRMPLLGTTVVDAAGLEAVDAWIESLAPTPTR